MTIDDQFFILKLFFFFKPEKRLFGLKRGKIVGKSESVSVLEFKGPSLRLFQKTRRSV